jgi:hypothetical protein
LLKSIGKLIKHLKPHYKNAIKSIGKLIKHLKPHYKNAINSIKNH